MIAAPYYSPTYHPPFVAGGRVSDAYDRRVLSTYLDEYLGDFVFDACQPFHLHMARDGSTIDVLQAGHRDDYVAAIDALPLEQSPEVRHNTPSSTPVHIVQRHRQHCGPSEKHADDAGK